MAKRKAVKKIIDKRKFNKGTGRKAKPSTPVVLDLSTITATRESFARIIEAYNENRMKETRLTRLVYSLQSYLGYLKTEKDIELEKRLDAIEQRMEEEGNRHVI